jgi:threonine aldolase
MSICTTFPIFLPPHTDPGTSAPTEVIALENTLNGTIFPQDDILAISSFARSQGIKMHLDGARIWHVAAETGTPLKELCDPFDSVSLCFSKGLGNFSMSVFLRQLM